MSYGYYKYLEFDGERFFTVVMLPSEKGKFPTIISQSPYVQSAENMPEGEIVNSCLSSYASWLERGYAVIFQHCRGQGKSTGAFVPYVHEREDGLHLRGWIREQDFYCGELYLLGGSYSASLHYTTAPFESDVKGGVLEVQDTERYRLWYRNGQMRKGHANWHFGLYKKKCGLNKNFNMSSFSELPLSGLSERVLGERAEDFEQMLGAPRITDGFWNTRNGGNDARNATDNAGIPLLITTGYNDFYLGGSFRMWEQMSPETKSLCAMLVSPYDHGDGYSKDRGYAFPMGRRSENFGKTYQIDWLDSIRDGRPLPYERGKVAYYRCFEDKWDSDFYANGTKELCIGLGNGEATFVSDPADPPSYPAEGRFLEDNSGRNDVVTVLTDPFESDVFVKGRMRARLAVSSTAEDTSFYVNISIRKPEGDYYLRHDVTSICYAQGDYTPKSEIELDFCFDEYAFLIKKGERLRIDIAPTDDNTYVRHTNKKGAYHLQTEIERAENTVYLSRSVLLLPVENRKI